MADQYTPADYDWLRNESLERAGAKAPHQFGKVFQECAVELRIKKFGG